MQLSAFRVILGFRFTVYLHSNYHLFFKSLLQTSLQTSVLEYTTQNTTMASSGGPEAEFDDPRRKELLQVLNDALPNTTFSSTVWACLWLSDIDILNNMVVIAKSTPILINGALHYAEYTKMVPTCMIIQRILPC